MDARARPQGSPTKQRRGSLPASPALNVMSTWAFRDEMGLPSSGVQTPTFLHERSRSTDALATSLSSEEMGGKRSRKKWSQEETQMLVDGCNTHGVGNWKAILNDPRLTFEPGRTPVDLKDRFRTYFPDAYRQHYPNAKTHLSDKIRSALPNGGSLFEKTRTKRRRPFSTEEDDALRRGYEKHGTLWAQIVQDPIFQAQQRRSTDLRDRFRNAFPDLYEAAGYKPRTPSKKAASVSQSSRSIDSPGKQEPTRSRAFRRRLTYPSAIQRSSATSASEPVDYSSADEDHHSQARTMPPSSRVHSLPHAVAGVSSLAPAPDQALRDTSRLPTPCRSTSPLPEHDAISQSSQSHMFSGPASPSSPDNSLSMHDLASREDDGSKPNWNGLDWLTAGPHSHLPTAPLTASSLFSANMFGSFNAGPHHDVLDRYDLYSSPLSSAANTFGDYVSEMGLGGTFSEGDMDFNAFAGPASSMGFTHHSQVAGDLIFASHHGGHLQHGHGFSVHDNNRSQFHDGVPPAATLSQQPTSTLGLSNVPFDNPPTHDLHDSRALESLLDQTDVSLAMLTGTSHDLARMSDAYAPTFTVSPADLTRPATTHPGEVPPAAIQQSQQLALPFASQQAVPPMPAGLTTKSTSTMDAAGPLPPIRRPSPHAHMRSASQPPTDFKLVDARRSPFLSFGSAYNMPTSTRDDSMHDLQHRSPDSYQLPFLDLHYYGVSDGSHAFPSRDTR